MLNNDSPNVSFQSVLAVCLLFVCAASHAQGADPQQDNKIKNPKECVQAELVWTETRDSSANSLISDYVFSYPEGIRVTSGCDKDVSVIFGVDATLNGIAGDVADDARQITVDFSSEDVLRCEIFPTLSFNQKTDFAEFPESVRGTAEKYHYERASDLASGRKLDIWANLHWNIRYQGCVEWTDESMKISTGYRHRCFNPCPGDAVMADYNISGEVVQETEISQYAAEQKEEITTVITEPKCLVEYSERRGHDVIRNGMNEDEKGCWFKISNKNECYTYYEWNADSELWRESTDSDVLIDGEGHINLEISWSGDCSNGVATGKGTLKWLADDEYKGELVNGKRHGQVTHESMGWDYRPGPLIETINYNNGTMHGLYEDIPCVGPETICIRKTNYQNGIRDGLEENFANGRLYERATWENGEETSREHLGSPWE